MSSSHTRTACSALQPTAATTSIGLQRKCACGGPAGIANECADCSHEKLSRQRSTLNPESQTGSRDVPPIVHEVLRSPGQPLDAETRAFFEPRFGHDFSRVRVHTDTRANQSAQSVNALAYTVGRDVVFGEDQYKPREPAGLLLLSHELTHVLQQNVTAPGPPTELSTEDDPHEQEAAALSVSLMTEPDRRRNVSVQPEPDAGVVHGGWPVVVAVGAGILGGIYAIWAYRCLTPLELPMYIATFGDTTVRAGGFRLWYFNQTHTPVPSNVWDGFGHCWIACESTKRCGWITAAIAGKSREFWREYIDSRPHDSYQQDTNNQTLGRGFGSSGQDCTASCGAAALPGGSLDRSAPVVTVWEPGVGEHAPPAPAPAPAPVPGPAPAVPDAGVSGAPPDAGLRDAGVPLPGGLP
jgi:hypothetical protein